MSPRKYTPSPKQRDERVNTTPDEVEPEELIRRVLRAGPHPEDKKNPTTKKK
jgi:hypothetical protein